MVKKIKADDKETKAEQLDREATEAFRDEVRDWMQRVDWKMWMMLKIVEGYAERDGIAQDQEEEETPTIVPNADVEFKPIIIEEEDV